MTLHGALNFRDVGGLPAGDGRRIAHRRLLRSDTLQFLTDEDAAFLVDEVGLRSIIDLRLEYEVDVEGRGVLAEHPVAHHNLPFSVHTADQDRAVPILQRDDPMVPHYLGYLSSTPESVVGVVRVIAESNGVPAIIHCAAGKDRTGVAVALVLAIAGVSDEDIAVDYAAGSAQVPAVMARLRTMESYGESLDRLPPEANLTIPETMSRFLVEVRSRYGSVEDFFLARGTTESQLRAVRDALTVAD